jgi:hypothetical protein
MTDLEDDYDEPWIYETGTISRRERLFTYLGIAAVSFCMGYLCAALLS